MKGDYTENRPHRYSEVTSVPEEFDFVTVEQLEALASEYPEILEPKRKTGQQAPESTFDLATWIEKYGVPVAFTGRWQNKGTKYIFDQCPWKENHNNRSAFAIQFDRGGISAGCLHDSCRQENWQTLRALFEPDVALKEQKDDQEDDSQADRLIRLGSSAKLCTNELDVAYAAVTVGDHTELWKVNGKQFKMWLTKGFYDETGKAPGQDAIRQALGVIEMKAMYDGEQYKLQLRIAALDDAFYYDLADAEWRVVKVSQEGCEILNEHPLMFLRTKNMKPQVEPDFDGDVTLLLRHVRFKSEDDQLLYLIYVISCLIPSIPHPVLVLCGEKGAAKSTSMRMTRAIIDPAMRDLLSMPNSMHDLALCLANNYMPCFDNLDRLSAEKSDLLCTASTGGGFSKRTLFTDEDETILEFKRCIGINGINVVVTRSDLLDRSIIQELERIDESERKEESKVWADFEGDKAQIVGGALMTLAVAMGIYPTVELDRLSRMADFTRWGYAIAQALGHSGEKFLEAYNNSQMRANEEVISSHPVAAAIVALIRDKSTWRGSVAKLLSTLQSVARKENINTHVKVWPNAPHMLSRRLKDVKSNLKQVGISFDIRPLGDAKIINIVKESILAMDSSPDMFEEDGN